MNKTKAIKNKKIFGIAAMAFLCVGIVHVGYQALEIASHDEWSAPWYIAFLSPGLIYIFPLIVCLIAYLFFSKEATKG
ncbi:MULTISPECIES: hypothetical protein [Odoribacteraceae]|uniref:hypothetical protein n=1 Tax=Odoribacteraceae TaxID=1853231 RepID=UPI000E54A4A3|nr:MULTISPECIES: hypothetical protein [Odoribacteraceae]MCQ4872674.1 hypothetical protein [Butyricimonas paravirosa]RHR82561.1 hypothetical protein DWW52_01430 [Odoribacter sp. AF15-53]